MLAMLSILRFRHRFVKTFNSISAIFNQLPCFGVYTNPKQSLILFASAGTEFHYAQHELRLKGCFIYNLTDYILNTW